MQAVLLTLNLTLSGSITKVPAIREQKFLNSENIKKDFESTNPFKPDPFPGKGETYAGRGMLIV